MKSRTIKTELESQNLNNIDIHSWYKTDTDGWISIERFATFSISDQDLNPYGYSLHADYYQNVPTAFEYTLSENTFPDTNELYNDYSLVVKANS